MFSSYLKPKAGTNACPLKILSRLFVILKRKASYRLQKALMSTPVDFLAPPPPSYFEAAQQQQQQPGPAHVANASVGPVIAVLFVITFLGVVAGMVGRLCTGRGVFGHGEYDFEGWVEMKCASCIDGRVDILPTRRIHTPRRHTVEERCEDAGEAARGGKEDGEEDEETTEDETDQEQPSKQRKQAHDSNLHKDPQQPPAACDAPS